jgi:hypothetical protein
MARTRHLRRAVPQRRLTLSIWKRYPDSAPYGGKYADIVPHMHLAQVSSIEELDKFADEFNRGFQANLPIHVTASEVALMDKVAGRWNVHTTFDLRAN